jgi:hypothetical protein
VHMLKETIEGQEPVTRNDLLALTVQPLSRQMNQSWLNLIQRIEELQETVEIIARQIAPDDQVDNETTQR